MDFSTTTVIIPTLNEEKNIGVLVDALHELYPKIEVIVTDDGSQDNTQKKAHDSGARVVDRRNERIKGITAAVLDAAKQVGTENVVVMDADLQHPPEKVRDIITKLDTRDIVIGARRRVLGHWGLLRKTESKMATVLAQLRIGKKIYDPLSGFFGLKKDCFHITPSSIEPRCFKILFTILKNNKKKKIGYVWYDFAMRTQGESKISAKHVWYFVKNLMK